MASEPRVVFDASVLVSAALLPRSVPRQAFDKASSLGRILISEITLVELYSVLMRSKFDRYALASQRSAFIAALVRESELVDITVSLAVCRDPKDDKYLDLAVSGYASHLVTGDGDLLVLHPYQGIAIVGPQAFLNQWIED